MSEQTLTRKLKAEIRRSIIISEEDKNYWYAEILKLPRGVLQSLYDLISAKNELMESYIKAALNQDTDKKYLHELKSKITEIKNNLTLFAGRKEVKSAEEDLENKLKNL